MINAEWRQLLDAQCLNAVKSSDAGEAQRIFHGRGGFYPGLEWLAIDALKPVLLFTCFSAPSAEDIRFFSDLFARNFQQLGFTHAVVQRRYLQRAPNEFIVGDPIDSTVIESQGLNFKIRLSTQNTGFFLDMAAGRQWLRERAATKNVLNLFAFTCAFSVVAHQAGAAKVVNVDMSKGALSLGRENHRLNPVAAGLVEYMPLNILKSWSRIKKQGPFDIVIIDPPSFQKGSFIAEKDYQKIIRRLPELCSPNADILACLNAPELDEHFLCGEFECHCPNALLQKRLDASPEFADLNPNRQLKVFHYRYAASE